MRVIKILNKKGREGVNISSNTLLVVYFLFVITVDEITLATSIPHDSKSDT